MIRPPRGGNRGDLSILCAIDSQRLFTTRLADVVGAWSRPTLSWCRAGTRLGLAEQHSVSYNDLSDAQAVDAVSGNAALNGVPVTVVAG